MKYLGLSFGDNSLQILWKIWAKMSLFTLINLNKNLCCRSYALYRTNKLHVVSILVLNFIDWIGLDWIGLERVDKSPLDKTRRFILMNNLTQTKFF